MILLTKKYDSELFGITIFAYSFLASAILGIITYSLWKSRSFDALSWVFVPLALIGSIIWLMASAGIVVDLISFISGVYGVNQVLLGATFLAIGNTLADFFANSSLAACGYGVMACTGSISGQLFNLLIGFGLNITKISSKKTHVNFKLLDFNKDDGSSKIFALMIIGIVVFYLLFMLAFTSRSRFALQKSLVTVNITFYCIIYAVFFMSAYGISKIDFN